MLSTCSTRVLAGEARRLAEPLRQSRNSPPPITKLVPPPGAYFSERPIPHSAFASSSTYTPKPKKAVCPRGRTFTATALSRASQGANYFLNRPMAPARLQAIRRRPMPPDRITQRQPHIRLQRRL